MVSLLLGSNPLLGFTKSGLQDMHRENSTLRASLVTQNISQGSNAESEIMEARMSKLTIWCAQRRILTATFSNHGSFVFTSLATVGLGLSESQIAYVVS